jgi:hypothetical protein
VALSRATVAAARWVGIALVGTLALLSVVAVHLAQSAERAVSESDRALAAGDTNSAIAWARDAAMSVAPLSSYPEQGYARLATIGKKAEARGDFDQAVFAWRATIAAIRATDSESSQVARGDEAKQSLIRLAGRVCEGGQTRSPAACSATAEAALAGSDLPTIPTFSWLALGAIALFGGGVGLSRVGARSNRAVFGIVMALGALFAALALASR